MKEDLLEMRPPSVVSVSRNFSPEDAVESLKRIASLHPKLVIPGHDAPFSPHSNR